MKDNTAFVLFILFAVLSAAVGIWIAFAAPCDSIDWMPVAEIPARCLR